MRAITKRYGQAGAVGGGIKLPAGIKVMPRTGQQQRTTR
jgi:hypothetical protein